MEARNDGDESVTYISDLEPARPQGGDSIAQGDDHIRNIKRSIKQTFPNVDGEIRATDDEVNYLVGLTEPLTATITANDTAMQELSSAVSQNTQDIASQGDTNTEQGEIIMDTTSR